MFVFLKKNHQIAPVLAKDNAVVIASKSQSLVLSSSSFINPGDQNQRITKNIKNLIYALVKLNNKKHLLKHSIFVMGRAYATSSH